MERKFVSEYSDDFDFFFGAGGTGYNFISNRLAWGSNTRDGTNIAPVANPSYYHNTQDLEIIVYGGALSSISITAFALSATLLSLAL